MSASRCFSSVDDSYWPLLINRLEGEASNQEFDAYLAQSTRFLGRGQPHVLVVDLSRVGNLPSEQRQRLAEWLRQNEEPMQRMVLGAAYICPSALIRLGLSIIFHLKRPPFPYLLAAREGQAITWALSQLEAVGLREPAMRIRHELGLVSQPRAG
ncbi:hypothetical protein NR798_34290 [Archangium gephyra]|uniref:hypothetical protein n=1 Tax=Archangium gephyra TaxID=48 RepID=UPI0035D48E77